MFSIFDLKRSTPLARAELRRLHYLLGEYARTDSGAWLRELPWQSYRYCWCEAMRDGDVMGAYSPIGRVIYLQPVNHDAASLADPSTWIDLIASTAVHELRHSWQHAKHPWLYILCCLPGVRQLTIERDANAVQDVADKMFERISSGIAHAEYEHRYGRLSDEQ